MPNFEQARRYGQTRNIGYRVETQKPSNGRQPDANLEPALDFTETTDPGEEDLAALERSGLVEELLEEEPSLTNNGHYQTDDLVKMYLTESGRTPLLTHKEEVVLAQTIEQGAQASQRMLIPDIMDEERFQPIFDFERADTARIRFTEANLRLVVSVAKKYMGRGLDLLDLIQEGNIGLMKAVEKYNWRLGFKFSTYTTWWIRQGVTRAIADQTRTIRLPVHLIGTMSRIIRFSNRFFDENGREPTPKEVGKHFNITSEKVLEIMEASRLPISLETPIGDDDNSCLGDFIEDPAANTAPDAIYEVLKKQVESVLNSLPDRERRVLELRFGLIDGRQRTLEEVGAQFGVTRERARQIEAGALRKLRHPTLSRKLKDYLK